MAVVVALAAAAGCGGRYGTPRALATLGGIAVGAGSAGWAVGESLDDRSHPDASRATIRAGFVTVAAGLALIVVAGGWMAVSAACSYDSDCGEDEQCREIPAPPGGVPYKQCTSR